MRVTHAINNIYKLISFWINIAKRAQYTVLLAY